MACNIVDIHPQSCRVCNCKSCAFLVLVIVILNKRLAFVWWLRREGSTQRPKAKSNSLQLVIACLPARQARSIGRPCVLAATKQPHDLWEKPNIALAANQHLQLRPTSSYVHASPHVFSYASQYGAPSFSSMSGVFLYLRHAKSSQDAQPLPAAGKARLL